ncbi:MAG: matrixin family metalloprotease [Acidobacteriota bacterium]
MVRAVVAVAAMVTGVAQLASASLGPRWSDAQLVDLSEVVLEGRVVGVTSAWDTTVDTLYTYVTLDVFDVLKGWVPERRIVIKQLGGAADGLALRVTGQPVFRIGEDVLLFLEVRPRDNTLYTTALWQGKWTLRGSGAARVAERADPVDNGAAFTALEQRPHQAFSAAIRAHAGDESRRPSNRFIRVVPAEAGRISQPFVLIDPDTPPRWFSSTLGVDYETGGQPGLPGGGITELGATLARWNAVGSGITLVSGTARSAKCTSSNENSGRTVISFMDDCAEISNAGGTLAVGGTYFTAAPAGTINGVSFHRALDGFVMNNDSSTALTFLQNPGCFADIQLHELGHVLGLGHTTVSGSIMEATINNACFSAANALSSDDRAGLIFIYPGSSGGTTPPSSAPTGVAVSVNGTSSLTVSWNAVTTDEGVASLPSAATSYRVDFRTPGGPVVASQTTTATSLTLGIPAGTTGTFTAEVTGVNSAGNGPTSAPVSFTIGGGGGSPGTVTNVQATVSGSTLTVSFTATGGSPTSFRLDFTAAPGGAVLATVSASSSPAQIPIPAGTTGTFFVTVTPLAGSVAGTPSSPVSFTIGGGGGGGVDGNYSGTTSQGHPISFTVAGGAVTTITWRGTASGSGCTTTLTVTTSNMTRTISNNAVTFTVTGGPGSATYTFSATFAGGSASGTLSFTTIAIPGVPSCVGSSSVTWTATR